jgi:hypothetical protein
MTRRAADIEVDLIAEILADAGSRCELARLGAAELQRHRMLARIEAEQPPQVARMTAPVVSISVYSRARRLRSRWNTRQCRSVQSIMGKFELEHFPISLDRSLRP